MARVLIEGEAPSEAIPHLETCLAIDPFQTEAWLHYAWALVRLGRIEPAHRFVQDRLLILTVLAPSECHTGPSEQSAVLAKLREDLLRLSNLLQATAA
jgi:hypothetical protein